MRSTVRHEMSKAVKSYQEKPREQWLFDYPAQVKQWPSTEDSAPYSRHLLCAIILSVAPKDASQIHLKPATYGQQGHVF